MGRNSYTVEPSAIDDYIGKVLHDNSGLTRRQAKGHLINLVKGSSLDERGLYPIHVRNGRQSLYYVAPDSTNEKRLVSVLTVEEVKALG